MMGSSFNRLLHSRLRRGRGRGTDVPLRDTVLAGCVTVLFFSMQSPELVDRWLWIPFLFALCFRSAAPSTTDPGRDETVLLHEPVPYDFEASEATPAATAPRAPYEEAEPHPRLRRVSGTVPAARTTRRPS
jgi:hypothetical protein